MVYRYFNHLNRGFPVPETLFTRFRKERGYTQAELGRKVFELLGKRVEGKYPQKRVSLWESGEVMPNLEECRALSKVLKRPLDEIQRSFNTQMPALAIDVFEDLARSDLSSIMAVCFSGPPRAPQYPEISDKIVKGVNSNLCFAMVVPYPSTLEIKKQSWSTEALEAYYQDVLGAIKEYRDNLRSRVDENKRSNIAVFKPNTDQALLYLAPFFSRYVLTVKTLPHEREEKHLYLWVETSELDQLQEVASEVDDSGRNLVRRWQAYFDDILSAWRKNRKKLPAEDAEIDFESAWKIV
jgi:transcriptional regulator with XRE-family HTH domain